MDHAPDSSSADRRHSPRTRLQRPVKLQSLESGRLIAGQSVDVSASGLLVEVASSHSLPLICGQRVAVALAWSSNQVLVKSASLQPAQVIRCLENQGHYRIALRLESAAPRLAA